MVRNAQCYMKMLTPKSREEKRNARLECFTSWVLEDDENDVNIVLCVCVCIWYALYRNSLYNMQHAACISC